jgi:hypothetical protein
MTSTPRLTMRLRKWAIVALSWIGLACACERSCCRDHQPWLAR